MAVNYRASIIVIAVGIVLIILAYAGSEPFRFLPPQ